MYLPSYLHSCTMDFHSVMETFAEAWVAANTHTPLIEAAEQGLIGGPPSIGHSSIASHSLIDTSNERHEGSAFETFSGCQSSADSQSGPAIMGELKTPSKQTCNPSDTPKSQKLVPLHCIVEQIPGPQACGQYVELDSYAIIPGDTLFNELVRTALVKLGYSDKQILGAKGSIQIKNWKPLAFDQITENPEATLSLILGDLITVATLHIRLYSVPDSLQEWTDATVRNAVLELLREMSQSKLAKLCPLSQPMLSNIINNRYMGKIGKEKCQEFGKWYLNYRKQHEEGMSPDIVPCDKPIDGRLTFHPTKELPMMRDWFQGCRNPTRKTLQMYVDLLNQGPVRQQERPKINLSTLKNWWKNEKQRERKQKTENRPNEGKRKLELNLKSSQFSEDSCVNNLQTIETVESHNISQINHKSTHFIDECSQSKKDAYLGREKHYHVLQGPQHNERNHMSAPIIVCPNDNAHVYKLHDLSSSHSEHCKSALKFNIL